MYTCTHFWLLSWSLMATSKPGNRGLHRAGWLSPSTQTADVIRTDFFFFPFLQGCVCAICNVLDSLLFVFYHLWTPVTFKRHVLESFYSFLSHWETIFSKCMRMHECELVGRLVAVNCRCEQLRRGKQQEQAVWSLKLSVGLSLQTLGKRINLFLT